MIFSVFLPVDGSNSVYKLSAVPQGDAGKWIEIHASYGSQSFIATYYSVGDSSKTEILALIALKKQYYHLNGLKDGGSGGLQGEATERMKEQVEEEKAALMKSDIVSRIHPTLALFFSQPPAEAAASIERMRVSERERYERAAAARAATEAAAGTAAAADQR
jgi:hypothetical protein